MNSHIEDFLKKYIKEPSFDYAVMIDGEWGSGKTYFINSFIKKHINWSWNKKACYCSLYGLTDYEDFKKRTQKSIYISFKEILIFLLLMTLIIGGISLYHYYFRLGQAFETITKDNISFFTASIIPIATLVVVAISYLYRKIQGILAPFILSNVVFIFDDLERTECTTRYALSLINYYVEQQHCKVIIIGNKKEILRKNKAVKNNDVENENNEYETIREKVIGKTFLLNPNHAEIISYLTKSIKNKIIKDVCEGKIPKICDFIKSIDEIAGRKHTNYRSIKHSYTNFTLNFASIIEEIPSTFREKVTWKLFCRYIVVEYGMQIGTFSIENIKNIIYFYTNYKDDNDPIAKKHNQFKSKFEQWNDDFFLTIEMWLEIFNNRVINQEILKHINSIIQPTQRENWNELYHYYENSDEDIEKSLQSVNTEIENNVYKDAVIILHVFATLLAMSKEKIIERSVDDILSQAKRYITNISPELEYDEYDELEYRQSNLLQFNKTNLGIHQNNSTECQELIKILEKEIKIKIQNNKKIPYLGMIKLFESDVSKFEEWASSEQGCKNIYYGQDPELLWNAWIKLSPKDFRDVVYCFSNSIIFHIFRKYPNTGIFWKNIFDKAIAYIEESKDPNGIIINNKAQCVFLQNFIINNNKKLIEKLNNQSTTIEPTLPPED